MTSARMASKAARSSRWPRSLPRTRSTLRGRRRDAWRAPARPPAGRDRGRPRRTDRSRRRRRGIATEVEHAGDLARLARRRVRADYPHTVERTEAQVARRGPRLRGSSTTCSRSVSMARCRRRNTTLAASRDADGCLPSLVAMTPTEPDHSACMASSARASARMSTAPASRSTFARLSRTPVSLLGDEDRLRRPVSSLSTPNKAPESTACVWAGASGWVPAG